MSVKVFYSFLIGLAIYLVLLGIFTVIKVIITKRKAKKMLDNSHDEDGKQHEEK